MYGPMSGRINRREYWIAIAVVLALAIGLAFTPISPAAANTGITLAWLFVWGRRLHDISLSAWWAAAPMLVMVAIVVAGFVLGGKEMTDAFGAVQAGKQGAASDKGVYEVGVMLLLMVIIQFGFTLWLGIRRGDPQPNRWGPARP